MTATIQLHHSNTYPAFDWGSDIQKSDKQRSLPISRNEENYTMNPKKLCEDQKKILQLEQVIDDLLQNEEAMDTPALQEVYTKENLITVKVDQVNKLQKFAANVKKKELQYLKTDPVLVTPFSLEEEGGAGAELKAELRLYLNGTGEVRGESVSLSVSLQGGKVDNASEFVVSFYLFEKNKESYRKSFTMKTSEMGKQKGLTDFISQQQFQQWVHDDSVVIGAQVLFAP